MLALERENLMTQPNLHWFPVVISRMIQHSTQPRSSCRGWFMQARSLHQTDNLLVCQYHIRRISPPSDPWHIRNYFGRIEYTKTEVVGKGKTPKMWMSFLREYLWRDWQIWKLTKLTKIMQREVRLSLFVTSRYRLLSLLFGTRLTLAHPPSAFRYTISSDRNWIGQSSKMIRIEKKGVAMITNSNREYFVSVPALLRKKS